MSHDLQLRAKAKICIEGEPATARTESGVAETCHQDHAAVLPILAGDGHSGDPPMATLSWLRRRIRLPNGIALMFGIGAISAIGANGDQASALTAKPVRLPQQSVKYFGELKIWSERGRVYLMEQDGTIEEVALSDTPEAQHLRCLLGESGAVANFPQVIQHRIILVGGGGQSVDWPRDGQSVRRGATPSDNHAIEANGDSLRHRPSKPNTPPKPDVPMGKRRE